MAAVSVVVLFSTIVCGSPTPTPTPIDLSKVDFSQFKPEDIAATEAHREQLKAKLRESTTKVLSTSNDQASSLQDVKAANLDTLTHFKEYQSVAESEIAKGNIAIAALAHVLKQLHRAKMIMCGLVLAVAALVLVKMGAPIGAYAAGAIAVGGCAAVWIWL